MQILFKWGPMTAHESGMYGLALLAYAPALLFQSIVVILNRAFYSIQNTRTPLMISACTIGLNILANIYFVRNTDLGAIGTALAFVITDMLYVFALVFLFTGNWIGFNPDNFIFLRRFLFVQ